MEFNVSSADLLKSMLDVSKAIPAKTSNLILENFLFVLKGDNLEITASDSELTLRTVIQVENTLEEGSMAVPARQIIELFKELPDQPIRFKTKSDTAFDCYWANGNSSLPLFPAEDYPEIKWVSEDCTRFTMPATSLLEGLAKTIYATADDEMRPAMNGIFFDIDANRTTMVASDSHKLICYTTDDASAEGSSSFILHKKPAAALRAILEKCDDTAEISFDDKSVMFTFAQTVMCCRLVVGKYPKYRDVIPQNNSNILRIDRIRLLNSVRRISVCSSRGSSFIKLQFNPGQVEISSQDLGFALEAYEKIECDYSGEPLDIGFKSPFIIDILSNMSCESIIMKFSDPRRAALVMPSEEEADKEKVCGIVMPIMVA